MKLNKDAYTKLINDDAKWIVENTKDCLERKHILEILWASIGLYYPNASDSIELPIAHDTKPTCDHEWVGLYGMPAAYECKKCKALCK